MDYLDRIIDEFSYIDRAEMSKAEVNICKILIEAELAEWDIDENGNTIFMKV